MAKHQVLIVGPAWVGDMVMAHSLVQTLHSRFSDIEVDVIAPTWSIPLVERMPGVHRAVQLPLGHGQFAWQTRWKLGKSLRKNQYTEAIVIPRAFKAALVPFHASIPKRTGFLGESRYGLLNDIRKLDKTRLDGTAKRYVALGLERNYSGPIKVPAPRLSIDKKALVSCLERCALEGTQARIALMPGAEYGPAKQWPATHFASLARLLVEQQQQVIVVGSQKEHALGATIVEGLGPLAINLCGKTELVEAVDLLSSCRAVVSNDSGLMHVAAAVGVPVVALYGSSSPAFTPPLTDKAEIFYRHLECSPCFKRTCPLGHTNCLNDIEPALVATAVLKAR